MNKLLLINPSSRTRKEGLGQRPWQATPPLALGYIAALTPPDWEVRIVDEYIEPINFHEPADLVDNQKGSTRIEILGKALKTLIKTRSVTSTRFAYPLNTGT